MIIKKVRGKNFFSIGNEFTEIDVQKYGTCVIVGKNGAGKSTINNMILFGCFGKPIKKVTKAQIVNSINGKGCVVEVELVGNTGKDYLIRRGIKPNLFEIYEDGVLVDQTLVGDYQDYLESTVLGCTHRTFLLTSIITVENHRPFMTLDAKDRREFIEDILDIKVFSGMNTLIKHTVAKNKEELRLLESQLKVNADKASALDAHIKSLDAMRSTGIESIDARLQEYRDELDAANIELDSTASMVPKLESATKKLREQRLIINDLTTQRTVTQTKITQMEKELHALGKSGTCPTCSQEIDPSKNHDAVCKGTEFLKTLKNSLKSTQSELDTFSTYEKAVNSLNKHQQAHNDKVSGANAAITRINRAIKTTQDERTRFLVLDDTAPLKMQLDALKSAGNGIVDSITKCRIDADYNSLMMDLFKDSGIKSKIVDMYIPYINQMVNEYLEKLDFFVSFHLDSEFNEVIKSRHRDVFTYSSFSAGEKQRVDMAILFAMRRLAKMRNSFDCNLLFLDETLDGSVDAAGIELTMNILNSSEFDKSNIIVISHANRDVWEDAFDGCYEVTQRDGFTQISE